MNHKIMMNSGYELNIYDTKLMTRVRDQRSDNAQRIHDTSEMKSVISLLFEKK